MDEKDETLDLVNEDDVVVGTIKRDEMVKVGYRHPGGFVRFSVGFLINKNKQIWVPTRGKHKVVAPGGLDFSVAEHVLSGETYEQAIIRAFSEEAGLQVDKSQLVFVGKLRPTEPKPSYEAVFVYEQFDRAVPKFSRDEFDRAQWMDLPELESKLNDKSTPSKSAILPALQLIKNHTNN